MPSDKKDKHSIGSPKTLRSSNFDSHFSVTQPDYIFTIDHNKKITLLSGEIESQLSLTSLMHEPEFIDGYTIAATGNNYTTDFKLEDIDLTLYFKSIKENEKHVLILAYRTNNKNNSQNKKNILSSALEQTDDLVMISDKQGIIEYINPAFEKETGYQSHEAIGQKTSLLNSGKHDDEFYKKLWSSILSGSAFSEIFINSRKDNSIFYEEKTISPVKNDNGEITHFISTGKNISDRMRTQERLHYMANHDALTKLPNRILFNDRLRQAMARAKWHNRHIAVMCLDLDHFKEINDALGNDSGDKLLIEITKRLENSIRSGDTVARLGGDEFAILLDDVASEKDISQLAKKILDTTSLVFKLDGKDLHTSVSIGVSIFPTDGDDPESLIRAADAAMHRAKDLGRNTYQFHSEEMSAREFERFTLENSLRQALKRNEFFLLYQPQYDISKNKIVAVEALLRWQHPELGVVPPIKFVQLLEETGLIVSVGKWVFKTACQQASQWHKEGYPDLNIAINISSRQCNDPNFVRPIEQTLIDTNVNPNKIEVELTENMLMRNASKTIGALNTLAHLGIRIAVDDFGTGYSSLNYLRRFPINTLKIDRSFIRDIIDDKDDAAITTAIIVMAKSLSIDVVAEGIETQDQLDFLKQQGCRFIQGDFISSAVSANTISKMLKTQASTTSESKQSDHHQ